MPLLNIQGARQSAQGEGGTLSFAQNALHHTAPASTNAAPSAQGPTYNSTACARPSKHISTHEHQGPEQHPYNPALKPTLRQEPPILRHIQGFYGLELNAGIAAIGKFLTLEGSYYLSSCWQTKLGLGAGMEKSKSITYKIFFLQPTIVYTLFSNKRNCYVNMLGGGLFSYEHYQEQRQKKERHNFNVGLVMGGELALFFLYRYELLLAAGPRVFFFDNPYGQLDYYLSLGLRLTF